MDYVQEGKATRLAYVNVLETLGGAAALILKKTPVKDLAGAFLSRLFSAVIAGRRGG